MSEKTTEEKVDLKVMFKNLPDKLIEALQNKLNAVIATEKQLRICDKTFHELDPTAKRLQDLRRKIVGGYASMDEFRAYEELKLSFRYLTQRKDQDEQERKNWAGTQRAYDEDFGEVLSEILEDLRERTRQDWSGLYREIMYIVRDVRDLSPKCLEALASLDKLIGAHRSRTKRAVQWFQGKM